MAPRRYLIIGDGAAGTSAAQHVRGRDPTGLIAIYSDDPHPAYFRAALTNYLLGELTEEKLWAVPPASTRIIRFTGRSLAQFLSILIAVRCIWRAAARRSLTMRCSSRQVRGPGLRRSPAPSYRG